MVGKLSVTALCRPSALARAISAVGVALSLATTASPPNNWLASRCSPPLSLSAKKPTAVIAATASMTASISKRSSPARQSRHKVRQPRRIKERSVLMCLCPSWGCALQEAQNPAPGKPQGYPKQADSCRNGSVIPPWHTKKSHPAPLARIRVAGGAGGCAPARAPLYFFSGVGVTCAAGCVPLGGAAVVAAGEWAPAASAGLGSGGV